MDRKQVSKKDEIILQQLEVIRTMTENNLNRMGADFWGTPAAPGEDAADTPRPGAPRGDRPQGGREENTASSTGNDATEPPAAEAPPPPEKIEDLQAELEGYIGLASVKKEVKNLINMVTELLPVK